VSATCVGTEKKLHCFFFCVGTVALTASEWTTRTARAHVCNYFTIALYICVCVNVFAPFDSSYLVDPASSHMLVSKIKPCMSKYKHLYTVKLRTAHYISYYLFDGTLLHGYP
jgi:hypothetical protein